MDKVVKVEERLIPHKFVELPVSFAAGLFARSCQECSSCILVDSHSGYRRGACPFVGKACHSITREDWEEYLNA